MPCHQAHSNRFIFRCSPNPSKNFSFSRQLPEMFRYGDAGAEELFGINYWLFYLSMVISGGLG